MTRQEKIDFIYDFANKVDEYVGKVETFSDETLDELVKHYKRFYKEF